MLTTRSIARWTWHRHHGGGLEGCMEFAPFSRLESIVTHITRRWCTHFPFSMDGIWYSAQNKEAKPDHQEPNCYPLIASLSFSCQARLTMTSGDRIARVELFEREISTYCRDPQQRNGPWFLCTKWPKVGAAVSQGRNRGEGREACSGQQVKVPISREAKGTNWVDRKTERGCTFAAVKETKCERMKALFTYVKV